MYINVICLVLMIGELNAYLCDETCFSCSDCTSKLISASHNQVVCVDRDFNETELNIICINAPDDLSFKTLDCQGFKIEHEVVTTSIFLSAISNDFSNFTIRNCVIDNFMGTFEIIPSGKYILKLNYDNFLVPTANNVFENLEISTIQFGLLVIDHNNQGDNTNYILKNSSFRQKDPTIDNSNLFIIFHASGSVIDCNISHANRIFFANNYIGTKPTMLLVENNVFSSLESGCHGENINIIKNNIIESYMEVVFDNSIVSGNYITGPSDGLVSGLIVKGVNNVVECNKIYEGGLTIKRDTRNTIRNNVVCGDNKGIEFDLPTGIGSGNICDETYNFKDSGFFNNGCSKKCTEEDKVIKFDLKDDNCFKKDQGDDIMDLLLIITPFIFIIIIFIVLIVFGILCLFSCKVLKSFKIVVVKKDVPVSAIEVKDNLKLIDISNPVQNKNQEKEIDISVPELSEIKMQNVINSEKEVDTSVPELSEIKMQNVNIINSEKEFCEDQIFVK